MYELVTGIHTTHNIINISWNTFLIVNTSSDSRLVMLFQFVRFLQWIIECGCVMLVHQRTDIIRNLLLNLSTGAIWGLKGGGRLLILESIGHGRSHLFQVNLKFGLSCTSAATLSRFHWKKSFFTIRLLRFVETGGKLKWCGENLIHTLTRHEHKQIRLC